MEKKVYWSERIAFFAIGVLSIIIMILSSSYGLGTLARPGPGLYPFIVGLFVLPLSLSLLITSLRYTTKGPILDWRELGTFLLFVGTCVFWIVAMPLLGYAVVTLISTFFLSKLMKLEGWVKPLILSFGTGLFIYLLFDYWLYIDLPRGVLG